MEDRILGSQTLKAALTTGSCAADQALQGLVKDPLTGLQQQDFLLLVLAKLLRHQSSQPVVATLALLQLENFYEIRRWVGRSEADLLLGDIARLITQSLPGSVLLCRCPYYEFAALLLDNCSSNARLLTDRVKQALQSAVSASLPPQLELKCAVGLAPVDPHIPTAEVLFARARHALSLDCYHQRQQDHGAAAHNPPAPLSLSRLQSLLQKRQLGLSFQALVKFDTDGLRHYELRCVAGSVQCPVPSTSLFDTAVRNALGESIDRWVLSRALRLLLLPANKDLRLTVNLSQNTLVSPRFFPWLRHKLQRAGIANERLQLQVSELDLLCAQHHMGAFSRQLKDLQIKLCVSHFGCTPDPFRYLILLRAHAVKLHVSLLERINMDRDCWLELCRTIERIRGNGLRVIAPGIEDLKLLPLLWEAKVNFVQGFALHQPGPATNFCFPRTRVLDLAIRSGNNT